MIGQYHLDIGNLVPESLLACKGRQALRRIRRFGLQEHDMSRSGTLARITTYGPWPPNVFGKFWACIAHRAGKATTHMQAVLGDLAGSCQLEISRPREFGRLSFLFFFILGVLGGVPSRTTVVPWRRLSIFQGQAWDQWYRTQMYGWVVRDRRRIGLRKPPTW